MMRKLYTIIMLAFAISVNCQEENRVNFKYPLYPGDINWSKYVTNQERIKALQIPNAILTEIPTNELLEVCVKFPLWYEIWFSNNFQDAFANLANRFNGFMELKKRPDIVNVLIEKEKTFFKNHVRLQDYSTDEQGILSFQCFVLNMIVLQKDIAEKMDDKKKEDFCEALNKNEEIMHQFPSVFSGICQYTINELKNVLNVKSKPKVMAVKSSPSWTPANIYTPRGTLVPGVHRLTTGNISFSTTDSIALKNYISATYNGAIMLRVPSLTYDAPGYTWHTSETGDEVVFNVNTMLADTLYVSDGSYIEVPEALGTKVVYNPAGDFSAVKYSSNWYISKWGYTGPLVKHHPRNIPDGSGSEYGFQTNFYPNSELKFYMRRPQISISGDALISSSGTYSVSNLPSGYSVVWSVSDSYYNSHIHQNAPSMNKCTIICAYGHEMYNGTLTADIYYGGTKLFSESKTISIYKGFKGTYYNGVHHRNVVIPIPVYTSVGGYVEIDSPNLINSVFSFSGITPSSYQFNSNTGHLRINFPNSTEGTTTLNILTKDKIEYSLQIITTSNPYLSVIQNDSQLDVEIKELNEDNQVIVNIDVINLTTGETVYSQANNSETILINTLGWKPGIYSIRAVFGKETLHQKVIIK